MIGRIPIPKQTLLDIFGSIRSSIFIETIIRWRQGELRYYIAIPMLIANIILNEIGENYWKSKVGKDWKMVVFNLLNQEKVAELQFWSLVQNKLFLFGHFCGVFPAIYFNRLYVVYSIVALNHIVVLVNAIRVDRIIWHATMGNRIDLDTADQIYSITIFYKNMDSRRYNIEDRLNANVDISEIRLFLCDGLRRQDMRLGNVKSLLEAFPGYLYLPDQGGMSPFELACQFAYVDIVQYMVELDENLLNSRDDRGNTPLHWVCRNTTSGSLKLVNCLLEKRMSLVTIPNKNGDLPIHVASDVSNHSTDRVYYPECIEVVWCLLLAYPECLNCRSGNTCGSNGKDIDDKKNR